MLVRLSIRQFATIDSLELEWKPGFTTLTGETGAGKSIIIEAIGALLGDRLGPEVVRTGAARATVEGAFSVDDRAELHLAPFLEEHGVELEEGLLLIARDIAAAGARGGARINGRMVPLSVLQALGEQLVDIHGQSQHMGLLRVREQREYLDRFAGLQGKRAEVARCVRRLRQVRQERATLQMEERQTVREREILEHEIAEIDAAELQVEEEESLRALKLRYENAEKLSLAASTAYAALEGQERGEAEQPGAVDLIGQAMHACQDGARFDEALSGIADSLATALTAVEDAARDLRGYLDEAEVDPGELDRLEERLFLLASLKRKYGSTLAEVLAYAADARARLALLNGREEVVERLASEEADLLEDLSASAGELSRQRTVAAQALAGKVERELGDLQLASTRLAVAVQQQLDDQGVPIGDRWLAFDASGVDSVEFLVQTNVGEELRPLNRVVSGGELARLALALKTVLAQSDEHGTLIFDEVDVGVGGRTAPRVGEKLWTVASRGHQVLCITHMPQVAAYADAHVLVSKGTTPEGRTRTEIAELGGARREEELALMLAGSDTETSRSGARELLGRADDYKRAHQGAGDPKEAQAGQVSLLRS